MLKFFFYFALLSVVFSRPLHWTFMSMIEDKPLKEQFKYWHYAMNKPYTLNSEHASTRFTVFEQNANYIKQINSQGNDYQLGLGPFADITFEEFSNRYLKINSIKNSNSNNDTFKKGNLRALMLFDDLVDYEEKRKAINLAEEYNKAKLEDNNEGAIDEDTGYPFLSSDKERSFRDYSELFPSVRDQGDCGSCWAFATSALIEAAVVLSGKEFSFMSPQQLLDCDSEDAGCNGGWYKSSLNYIKNTGIEKEDDYKYLGIVGNCQAKADDNKPKTIVKKTYECDPDEANCNGSATRALKYAPYGTAIFANEKLMLYKKGVLDYGCKKDDPNHAVVIVHATNKYLKIRNSWGSDWGEQGYFRFARKRGNNLTCYMEKYIFQVLELN